MANRKISDLTALTAPASGDFLPIVDISEAAAASKNKKITYSDFLNNIPTGTITSTMILDGTILNADINASAAIVDTKLATIATGGKVSNSATTATDANTASAIVARDASGNFSAGTITAALTGAASSNVLKAGDTMTGALVVPLASAATPSLTFTGDLDSGVFSPGANQVAVATNGTGRLFIDATGNVGVGAAANANGVLRLNVASGNNANLVFSENNTDRYILGQVTGDNALRVYDIVAASERLRITSAGLVGIGASNPTAKLESYFSSTNPSLSSNTGAGLSVYGTSTVRLNFGNYPASPYSSWVQSSDGIGNAWPIALNPLGGNVGIGTTAPNRKLEVSDAGADNFIRVNTTGATKSGIEFASSGTVYSQLYFTNVSPYDLSLLQQYTTGSLILGTNSTEKARLTSSGQLLVGTSTARANFVNATETTKLQIEGAVNISAVRTDDTAFPSWLILGKTRSTGNTIVQSGDIIGRVAFEGNDGSEFVDAAFISAEVDGTPGANDMPGRIVLATTANGASSPTERMRINAAGAFKASLTGTYDNATSSYHELRTNTSGDWIAYFTQTTATNPNGVVIKYSGAAPNNTGSTFLYCEDTVGVKASIRSNGGIANFSANDVNLSDINSKKDISPAVGTWDCIKEWEIVNYRYKDQPDDADLNLGVIAQQVAESCPEVITVFEEAKEATEDAPAQEQRLGVKEQQMYWMAIKALQEAQVRIEQLESKVAALEAQ
jgi:hypothetical protein